VELTGCNMVYATTSGQHSLVHCIGCYSDRFCDYRTSMAACSSSKDEALKKLSSIFLFKTQVNKPVLLELPFQNT
jgi:hypothetical protein